MAINSDVCISDLSRASRYHIYKIRHILIISNKKRQYIFKDKTVSCKMFGNWLIEYNYYIISLV